MNNPLKKIEEYLKQKKHDDSMVYPNPNCGYCNKWERTMDVVRLLWMVSIIICSTWYISTLKGEIQSQCCQKVKALNIMYGGLNDAIINAPKEPTNNMTLETLKTTTTTTKVICPICYTESTTTQTTIPCEQQTCPECKQCPECFTLTETVKKKALNWKPTPGAVTPYVSGGYDCKDYYLELFQIPNRSKFTSRPSNGLKPAGDYGGLIEDGLPDTWNETAMNWTPNPIIRWNET